MAEGRKRPRTATRIEPTEELPKEISPRVQERPPCGNTAWNFSLFARFSERPRTMLASEMLSVAINYPPWISSNAIARLYRIDGSGRCYKSKRPIGTFPFLRKIEKYPAVYLLSRVPLEFPGSRPCPRNNENRISRGEVGAREDRRIFEESRENLGGEGKIREARGRRARRYYKGSSQSGFVWLRGAYKGENKARERPRRGSFAKGINPGVKA